MFTALLPYSPNILYFTDLEPTCVVLCLIYILLNLFKIKIKQLDVIWITVLLLSLSLNLLMAETITDFRNLAGGFSFLIFFIFGFFFLPLIDKKLFLRTIKLFWVIWISAIFLQIFDIPLDFLAPNRTTIGRGFTSLAPEQPLQLYI